MLCSACTEEGSQQIAAGVAAPQLVIPSANPLLHICLPTFAPTTHAHQPHMRTSTDTQTHTRKHTACSCLRVHHHRGTCSHMSMHRCMTHNNMLGCTGHP